MTHPYAWHTDTLERLRTLAVQLAAEIVESREARARLVRALEANAWPDVPAALLRVNADRPAASGRGVSNG